jgi:hypothetical protein
MEGFRACMELESSGPSALYHGRCFENLKKPPPDSWDGVFNLTEK